MASLRKRDIQSLSRNERIARESIRALLLTATMTEMEDAMRVSRDSGSDFKADCIQEMIDETHAAGVESYGDIPL
jgi:hypothetical protein